MHFLAEQASPDEEQDLAAEVMLMEADLEQFRTMVAELGSDAVDVTEAEPPDDAAQASSYAYARDKADQRLWWLAVGLALVTALRDLLGLPRCGSLGSRRRTHGERAERCARGTPEPARAVRLLEDAPVRRTGEIRATGHACLFRFHTRENPIDPSLGPRLTPIELKRSVRDGHALSESPQNTCKSYNP